MIIFNPRTTTHVIFDIGSENYYEIETDKKIHPDIQPNSSRKEVT